MARPLLPSVKSGVQHALPSAQTSAPTKTRGDLRVILRRPRSAAYLAQASRLDAGHYAHSKRAVDELIAAIAAEFPELALPDYPIGYLSRCYLGAPYEVHTLDVTGGIIEHFKVGQAIGPEFDKGRALALHSAYEVIEIHRDAVYCLRADGSAVRV